MEADEVPKGRRSVDPLTYLNEAIRLDDQRQAGYQEVGYVARLFAQIALPYQDPGSNAPGWQRSNGGFTLTIQPRLMSIGADGAGVYGGLPYGIIPRLLLAYVTTEAVKTGEPLVHLGSSLREFCRRLDLDDNGPGMRRLKDQSRRLFSAHISAHYEIHHGGDLIQEKFHQMEFATNFELWHSEKDPDQAALFDNYVELSPVFFEEALRRPVPLDMDVLRLIKSSPMRLDIYTWLTHRMSYLRDDTLVTWGQLRQQFGTAATTPRGMLKFQTEFERHLNMVKAAYPGANATVMGTKGVLLKRGTTSVRRKAPNRMPALAITAGDTSQN